jgi:UDP-N-acetylglucosamine 2-epimerase
VGARPNFMKIAPVIRAMKGATPPLPMRPHILATVDEIVRTGGKAGRVPELWDGRASQRIAAVLREWLDRAAERLVA